MGQLENSCLYDVEVTHQRLRPKPYLFKHKLFMLYLDLDELPKLNQLWGVSYNKVNLYSFLDTDRLPGSEFPIKEKVLNYIAQFEPRLEIKKIFLLTQLRTLGYLFSPVSFYFCFDSNNNPLAVLTEVENTFREIKPYLMTQKDSQGAFVQKAIKHFYVSPFLELDMEFDLKLSPPSEKLQLSINTLDRTETPILKAFLTGTQKPLTNSMLWSHSLKYPWVTFQIIFLIHWHALILWLKKIPFHLKESNPHLQTGILNPLKVKPNTF